MKKRTFNICCSLHQSLIKAKVFYLFPSLIHLVLHIVVGFLLYDYVPNKKILLVVGFLDLASHYIGIVGFGIFIFSFIKNFFFKKKN